MDAAHDSVIISGAKAGAVTAAVLSFSTVTMPAIMGVISMPAFVCMLPVIFIYGSVAAAVASVGGGVVGALGAITRIPMLGALIGCSFFLLVGSCLVQHLFSPNEPWEEPLSLLLHSAAIGYASGGVAWLWSRVRERPLMKGRSILAHIRLLSPVILAVLVWEAYELRVEYARAAIENAGGDVTWDALEDPQGYYRVDFFRTQITDSQLKELASSLSWIRRLDLILDGHPVTNEGLRHIQHLKNTTRLHLKKTLVTDDGVEGIRDNIPGVAVYR
jgi:hypothetical protein